MVFKNMSYRD